MTGHDIVVCFGFEHDRIRRQPWHVARGIADGLRQRGRQVTLLTDARQPPSGEPYAIRTVPRLFDREEPSRASREVLAELAPDRVFVVIGAHAFLRGSRLRFGWPTFLVVAVQQFDLDHFLQLPWLDLWRERHLLGLVAVGSMIPAGWLRRGFDRSGAAGLVFLSEAAKVRFEAQGLGPCIRLVPQVDPVALAQDRVGNWTPTIVYAGPPLALRGADLAVQSFEAARESGLNARLLLLLRPDGCPAAMARFVRMVKLSRWRSSIDLVTDMLSGEEMRGFLARADVHALPFRITVSDAPLVVIEAALTGRPVVVLDTPGVAEFARAFDGIVASTPAELPDALCRACRRSSVRTVNQEAWTRWDQAVSPLLRLQPTAADRWATIALIGIDGVGKTTLAERLRTRLRAADLPSTHVWSRFRNYTSKPLLALARLSGHNRKMRFGA